MNKKALFDLIPAILFFVGYLVFGIYVATAILMIACPIQVLLFRYWNKKFDNSQLITAGLVLLFGTATLVFHNPRFIQWKMSVLYWLFALLFFGSHFVTKKTITHYMLQNKLLVPDAILRKANAYWGLFFLFLGFLNLYIMYFYSQTVWVYFKLFGTTGLLLAATFGFAFYLSKHIAEDTHG